MRNGLRVVSERVPGVRSVALGVWVNVGSRCEQPDEGGLSHFLEHLVFKGTRHRNARQIAESLESLGGSLNAFTTREHTCYTARLLDEHLGQAVDVLSDLTCCPSLTGTSINRERQVIIEEIRESLDNPSDHVHDLFAQTHWGGHPLGRPIMGTQEIIQSVPRSYLTGFRRRNYRCGSVVIAASGAISHERMVNLVRTKFSLPDGEAAAPQPAERRGGPQVCFQPDDNAQTHLCVGFPGIPFAHPDRMPVILLASYLGGGMSSVLFQKIREQRGLAYSVYCYHDAFTDAGLFAVYVGTDQQHLRQAFDLIMVECRRMKKRRLDTAALSAIKAQVKGHLTLGMESTSARMTRLGRQELLLGRYISLEESLAEIERVSAEDIHRAAHLVLDESQITLTALGPADPDQFGGIG
jgi:predicted Zn-dependent peptidase